MSWHAFCTAWETQVGSQPNEVSKYLFARLWSLAGYRGPSSNLFLMAPAERQLDSLGFVGQDLWMRNSWGFLAEVPLEYFGRGQGLYCAVGQ